MQGKDFHGSLHDNRRIQRSEFVSLAQRTFAGVVQPVSDKGAREQTCIERAAALHQAMVERLYDSQDACARLSHAIAAMTADKATRIKTPECGLAAEQHTSRRASCI